jgi:hypothetical protein
MALYTNYNLDKDVSYTNNREYRKCLRELFNMKCIINEDLNDIDEETKDELLYDENTMSAIMDEIFNATKNNELFNELYDLAAIKDKSITHKKMKDAMEFVKNNHTYINRAKSILECFNLRSYRVYTRDATGTGNMY